VSTIISTEGVPLYVKIREVLRTEILNGNLKRGQKIPSEDELAARYGVSRMTVRQGILDLIDEGLLYRRQGLGTFVAFPHIERDHTRLTSFFESARQKGIHVAAKVLNVQVVPSRRKIAEALDIPVGEAVIHIRTLRYANHVPVTLHDAYIPEKLFTPILSENLEDTPLWDLLEKYGYRVKRAIQRLEAREADPELARMIGLDPGAPILYKERTIYAEDGTPVEFTYCYNRGDLYSLTVSMER
jgi:GntR family transcriptional regulator